MNCTVCDTPLRNGLDTFGPPEKPVCMEHWDGPPPLPAASDEEDDWNEERWQEEISEAAERAKRLEEEQWEAEDELTELKQKYEKAKKVGRLNPAVSGRIGDWYDERQPVMRGGVQVGEIARRGGMWRSLPLCDAPEAIHVSDTLARERVLSLAPAE